MIPLPQGPDPLQSLSSLMTMASQLEDRKAQRADNLYRQQERARVTEDRATMQSAQSSTLPPEEVKKQLALLGRGDLVPIYEEAHTGIEANRLKLREARESTARAEANYWGRLGSTVLKAKGDPLAIEWALSEAEKDGHDVTKARETVKS